MLGQSWIRRGWFWLVAWAMAVGMALVVLPAPAQAADPCGVGGNKIACENSKPGTDPGVWDVQGSGDASIQGFATDISVNVGQTIDFKVDTDAADYDITIYRMGYYGGLGARQIATVNPSASLPQNQPQCITDVATELYDCGNWAVSASWNVPSTAVSGVYIAKLHRADRNDSSHITFVVRDDASTSDLVFQTSDTSWQAYNPYGGSNFYQGASNGRAYKLSYNRPVLTRDGPGGRDFFFSNEYPLVRFLEKNGYDVSYIAGVDTDRRGNLLTNHKTFLSVGHDEYWSGAQRANVEAARDAGVNLMFLSGNEIYWRTRYEPSADPSHTPYRTLVSYKETWSNAKIDPSTEWTGTWRDPRFAPPNKGGGRPENGLTGTAYMSNFSDLPVTVSAAEGKTRLWRNTSLATMGSGSAALAPHTVGYESNEDLDNGHRPAGLIRLSTTTGAVPEYLQDFGNTVAPGTTTHHTTMYRAPSGALVFSAGSVQWTWGLDAEHDSPYAAEPADVRMQQAQVNLLADMDAQPTTLAGNLIAATKSADTTGPTATISSPAAGAAQSNGSVVTVSGTASDSGGGVVAGVEASTDGGDSWHPATGTTSWSYTFLQHGNGSTPIRVRAIDDSANIGTSTSRSFNVSCPCSIFGETVPATPASNDVSAAELGLRFVPVTEGFVTGVRFYKGTGNTGTHVGSLWSTTGERLAEVTFANETSTGWQTAAFATPVAVTAGQTYVVSYTVPNGRYAVQSDAFSAAGYNATSLQVDGGFGATPAGVYADPGRYPTSSYRNSNYFVDVTFTTTDESPLIAMNRWPLPDSSSVPSTTTVSAKYSKAVVAGTEGLTLKDALGDIVPGTTSYDTSTRAITFTPDNPLNGFVKYTATLTGTDNQGNPITTGKSWSFTTAKPPNLPGVCPCTLFDDTMVPTLLEDVDKVAVELGVRFTADVNGTVTGVRFYKGVNNVGTHTGTLWRADGTQLATGTFTNESTTGWQTLTFASPVPITKNTNYIASYRAPVGRYSATPNLFAGGDLSRAPLHVTSSSGAYTYGTGFPDQTSAHSYLVDVVFEKGDPTIGVAGQDPAPGALEVPRNSPVQVVFTEPATTGFTMTVEVGPSSLTGTPSLSADGRTLTWTPAATMPADSDVTVTLSGVTSTEGASLPTQTWTFRTRGPESAGAQTLFGDQVPIVSSVAEGSPVELGTAFSSSSNGRVTAIRFFKGTGNDGTHTGSLWSVDGTRLATVTFTGETSRGWQTAVLSTPVPITSGTTYVVSYLAPQGHYSYTTGFFNQPWTVGDLTAPATNNGRYFYGVDGGFPVSSWGATNYFVDVVFERTGAMSVTGLAPASGSTDVSRSTTVSATFSAPLATGYEFDVSAGGSPVAGTTALSPDGTTLTFTPTSNLPGNTVATATVSGIASTQGATLGMQQWSFTTEAAPTVALTATSPAGGATNVARSSALSATFSAGLAVGYSFSVSAGGNAVTGTTALSPDGTTLTFTPSANLPGSSVVTATISGITSTQGATLGTQQWSFTTEAAPVILTSMFTGITPAQAQISSTTPTEVGVKFVPSVSGQVTAIRFFKGTQNTGTHVGSLWTSSGTRLAQVTFTGETANGWQQMALASPVNVTAGTTYVVSYYAPRGRYARTQSYFVNPWVVGPLTAPSGANGVYRTGTGGGFPTTSNRSSNYFVDVVFRHTAP